MPKEKYESPNPRRTHTLMSQEDIQAGKKSSWYELEITGTVRNLCPEIWRLKHLTSLYLNDNNLIRVPPDIARLEHLLYLDLSSNKIRSLPGELGDLIHLRELLLNHNQLRMLPYELGKLFNLQNLGLIGNPINQDMMKLYSEGTQKLLTYLLDSLVGDVGDVYIPRDRFSRESRGFAFVRYYDKRDAEDALDAMDGAIMDGRELRVQMARYGRPTEPQRRGPPRSRGGRDGGGRSRYGSRRSRSRSRSRSRGRRGRRDSRSRSRSRSYSRSRSKSRSRSRSRSRSSRSRSRSHRSNRSNSPDTRDQENGNE